MGVDDGAEPGELKYNDWPGFGRETGVYLNDELIAVVGDTDDLRLREGEEGVFDDD